MKEIGEFFVAIGVTGPAALFAFAAGAMLFHILKRAVRDVETNVILADALSAVKNAVLQNKETLARIEAMLERLARIEAAVDRMNK